MNLPLSTCCHAPLRTTTGDEGTSYYICTKCGNAADELVTMADNNNNPVTTETPGEFEQEARAIIDGQHTVARSDGKGGWIKVEELGVYLEDDGIDEVVAALSKLHQSDVARQVVETLQSARGGVDHLPIGEGAAHVVKAHLDQAIKDGKVSYE